ncbi:MAG TPA: DUF6798 domain-containing protein [Kofleriaceae bacterium]
MGVTRERLIFVVGLVSALVVTIAWASPYPTLNQATYLLDPMQRAMPELFHRDWFVSGTPPYLPAYGWLAQWLYVVDSEGTTSILIAHIVVNMATYAAIYWLVRALDGGWRAFAIVAAFMTATKGLSMGGSYLIAGYFQPSSLSTLGWIVGMAALVRGRYLVCGLAVACAGALHANFLVLGIGLFGLTALARRDLALRDYAMLLAPQLVVLAWFLPSLLDAAGPSAEALWVLTNFHAPVHYDPARLSTWIGDVVGWQIGAYAGLYLLESTTAARVLWRFSLIACAIVVGSALVIRYTSLDWLTQVRWSRIGPFGQLACAALMASALVQQVVAPRPLTFVARVLVIIAFCVPLYYTGRYLHLIVAWWTVIVAAVLVVVTLLPWRRVARIGLGALVAAAVGYALWKSPRGAGFTTTPSASPDELAMETWVRSHTSVDALFLAPPELQRFRVLARRAVIADTKSPPLQPDLLVQWYHRLCEMVRLPHAQTFQLVEARYPTLTPAELEYVARSFGADYIIVKVPVAFGYEPVFHNREFSIYRSRTDR